MKKYSSYKKIAIYIFVWQAWSLFSVKHDTLEPLNLKTFCLLILTTRYIHFKYDSRCSFCSTICFFCHLLLLSMFECLRIDISWAGIFLFTSGNSILSSFMCAGARIKFSRISSRFSPSICTSISIPLDILYPNRSFAVSPSPLNFFGNRCTHEDVGHVGHLIISSDF